MKKILITLLVFATALSAQDANKKREMQQKKMEQGKEQREVMKTAALTKHLNLTSEQAEKFFPLQNEFHQEAEKVKTAHRETVRKLRTAAKDDRSKYDVDAAIESEAGMKARLIRLEAKFLKDTKNVLTTEQRMKLMTFEQTMKKKIADNAKKNQMQKKDGPNKPNDKKRFESPARRR